jgi:predicted metalloprotease
MYRLANVFAWEAGGRWYYADSREAAAPIAEEIERYDSEGRILLFRNYGDSGVLIWDAVEAD